MRSIGPICQGATLSRQGLFDPTSLVPLKLAEAKTPSTRFAVKSGVVVIPMPISPRELLCPDILGALRRQPPELHS
jgi:hypothetical protein